MGLQHGDGQALYRDSLQAATGGSVLFGFRKIGDLGVPFTDLVAKYKDSFDLRFADLCAATGCCTAAIK